jgi:hypothetical protein
MGIRCASAKALCLELGLTREQARLIRRLAHAVDDVAGGCPASALRKIIEAECHKTDAYARNCYAPYSQREWRVTLALHAIDGVLGTYGVEALGDVDMETMEDVDMHDGPPFQYCNTGDSYAATLVYHRDADCIRIECWADLVEKGRV